MASRSPRSSSGRSAASLSARRLVRACRRLSRKTCRRGLVGARLRRGVLRLRLSGAGAADFARAARRVKCSDQIAVVARPALAPAFRAVEDGLDAVDGGKNEGDGFGGDRHAVAEFAHQALGGVRQRLEPRQAEKAAGAFDGMDEAKNIAENFAVIRLLLEAHELGVDPLETFVGLGQELTNRSSILKRLFAAALSTRLAHATASLAPQRAKDARCGRQAPRA